MRVFGSMVQIGQRFAPYSRTNLEFTAMVNALNSSIVAMGDDILQNITVDRPIRRNEHENINDTNYSPTSPPPERRPISPAPGNVSPAGSATTESIDFEPGPSNRAINEPQPGPSRRYVSPPPAQEVNSDYEDADNDIDNFELPSGQIIAESPQILQDCPICLGPFRKPTATNCGHLFCEQCLVMYLRDIPKYRRVCPNCNGKYVSRTNIHI